MAGIGDSWGTRDELLHPRGKGGRWIRKLKPSAAVFAQITRILDAFRPRTFPDQRQSAQYAHNIARPGRFGGGSELARFKADFDSVQEDLRDGIVNDPSTKRYIAMMDASAIELPHDVILTHTTTPEAFGLTPEQMDAESGGIRDLVNSTIVDRGYTATTIGGPVSPSARGGGRVTMIIAATHGTKAIPVGDGPNDREIILDRDQELQVSRVESDGMGGWNVWAVTVPRSPGENPPPLAGHVGPGKPSNREARIKAMQQSQQKRMKVPEEPAPAPAPAAAPAATPQAPRAPGVPPQGEAPAARKARRQQLLAQGGSAPTAPAGAPAPAPTSTTAPPTPTIDFRAAAREAGLPAPTGGKRRKEWNNAYQGVVSGKKHPEDVVRELDADIAENKRLLEQDRKDGTDSGPLPDDIRAQEQLRDLIKEKYGLGGQQAQQPASEAPAAPETPTPPVKKVGAPKAAKKAAPKAAPSRPPGTPVEPGTGKSSFTRPELLPKKTGVPRKAGPARGAGTPVEPGKSSFTRPELLPKKAAPRKVEPPSAPATPIFEGGQSTTRLKPRKTEALSLPKGRAPSKATKAPTTKAGIEEERQSAEILRKNIASMPPGKMRNDSQKLLDQMEEDFKDDDLVKEWVSGSGVREASLTEAERAHVARVARDVRTGKITGAEGARDLRTVKDPKLEKIARRVEGGAKVKTPRKPKAEPIDELDGKTVAELKAVAKAEGIKGYSKLLRDQLKEAIRTKRGAGPEAPAAPGPEKITKNVQPGDRATWKDPQTGELIHGTVIRKGRSTYVDWEGGRQERIPAVRPPKDISFERGAGPETPTPEPKKAQGAPETIDGLLARLNVFDNPPSREEARAAIEPLSKAQLVEMAQKLNIPGARSRNIPDLRRSIVEATVGRRIDSIQTRGFTGVRPGEGTSLRAPESINPPSPADRVTSHLMTRIAERDPAMRDRIMADMDPAARQDVREAIARAGGDVPPVTDAEVKQLDVPVSPEEADALKRASADDLREMARVEGLDIPEGGDKAEVQRNIDRALIQRELDKRLAAKAAKKAAPKKAAPRPEGAFEGLDVKEIGKGLELDLIPQGLRDQIQQDLDEGKKTPAAIGRETETMGANGPFSPAYQAAVARGVSGEGNKRRLEQAKSLPPGPERDAAVARAEEDIRKLDAELAHYHRQTEEIKKLAERLKVTRRKRATAPKPEEPTLTPKEEARATEVADLAGVPESKVQATIKARKVAAAPASDHGQGVVDLLRTATTREEGEALLKNRTKIELQDIAKAAGVHVSSRDTKPKITQEIVHWTIGRRLNSEAISRPGPEPGSPESDRIRNIGNKAQRAAETRGIASALSIMDELSANGSTAKAMEHRLRVAGREHKLDEGLVQRLVDAGTSGDQARITQLSDELMKAHGLKRTTVRTGETEPYDPTKHELIGSEVPKGTKVTVIRPGYSGDVNGEQLTVSRATVQFQGGAPTTSSAPGASAAGAIPTATERLRPLGLRPPRGKPGDKVSASALGPGDRVMVGLRAGGGVWERTARKTDSKAITVTRIGRTTAGPGQQSKYVLHGIDDNGNDVSVGAVFGQNVFVRAPLRVKEPLKAVKAAAPKLSANPEIRGLQIEDEIRQAVAKLEREPGAWVTLADLRDKLSETLPRGEVDSALVRVGRQTGVRIVPESNQKALSDRERAAQIQIGNQDKHLIAIETPAALRRDAKDFRSRGNESSARRLEEKAAKIEQEAKAREAAAKTPATTPVVPSEGPLKRVRPRVDQSAGKGPQQRPNADEPLRLGGGQMSGTGNMHVDSNVGELWNDLYQDDRASNSTLNRIAELAAEMSRGNRPFEEVLSDLRQLADREPDPEVKKRIIRAVNDIDAPAFTMPKLPDSTPEPLRHMVAELGKIPTARRRGVMGTSGPNKSVIDDLVDVIGKIDRDEGDHFTNERYLRSHPLHESRDGATQIWKIFDRVGPLGDREAYKAIRRWMIERNRVAQERSKE